MDTLRPRREDRAAAHAHMEAAARAFDNPPASANLDALQRDFDEAAKVAERANDAYEREVRTIEGRRSLPVDPTSEGGGDSNATYRRQGEHSFFADLEAARKGNPDALDRLRRNNQELAERRDLTTGVGVGGEFVPPVYLAEQWLSLARAARPFADLVTNMPLPDVGTVLTIPRLATGTATAMHAELGAVAETDPTTGELNIPVRTIAGQTDVSRQLLERTQPGIDEVILSDLVADYNTRVDVQALAGSGVAPNAKGVLSDAAIIAVTYTDASPTVPELYPKLADAIQRVEGQRHLPPSHVVMHPRRWAWLLAALDTSNRPLVSPVAPNPGNAIAALSMVGSAGPVGSLLGLPVVVDSNVPTNLGAATNEDVILVTRAADLWLWESGLPTFKVYEEVLSGNLAVRLQVYGYVAFTSERYSPATAKISGTGLVAPTF